MSQLNWKPKFGLAAKRYLEYREYKMLEDRSDAEEPYLVAEDSEDNSKVFVLLQAWSEELPQELPPEWRSWCEKQMMSELEHLSQPSMQRVRFDVIDMLVGEERALLRHHVNALGNSD